jgi:hypothetical protein
MIACTSPEIGGRAVGHDGKLDPSRRCCRVLFEEVVLVNNLSISILITRGETSRARAVDTIAIRVRPLAHEHAVCLGKQSHQLISQLASTDPLPAANTYPRPRTSTRRRLLAADQHDNPTTNWPILTRLLAVSPRYDI